MHHKRKSADYIQVNRLVDKGIQSSRASLKSSKVRFVLMPGMLIAAPRTPKALIRR